MSASFFFVPTDFKPCVLVQQDLELNQKAKILQNKEEILLYIWFKKYICWKESVPTTAATLLNTFYNVLFSTFNSQDIH